jgi:hypothetical protein
MSFWWNEKNDSSKNMVPSLDSGSTNFKSSTHIISIFETENFKNISSMFTKDEQKIAKYKSQNRTESEIAEIMGITVNDVISAVHTMSSIYATIYGQQKSNSNYRTINSKMGR